MYICNITILSLNKEENPVICYPVNKLWGLYAKWNEPVTERQINTGLHLYEVSKADKLLETEGMVVARGCWRMGSCWLRDTVSVLQEERSRDLLNNKAHVVNTTVLDTCGKFRNHWLQNKVHSIQSPPQAHPSLSFHSHHLLLLRPHLTWPSGWSKQNFLRWQKCSTSVLFNTEATSHMCYWALDMCYWLLCWTAQD